MSYGELQRFFDARNDLAPDRTIGIIALDQVEKVRRDGKRQFVAGKQNAVAFFIGKFEQLLELRQRRDAIFQLPFPIVPLLSWNIRPVTRRVRDKPFFLAIPYDKSVHFQL